GPPGQRQKVALSSRVAPCREDEASLGHPDRQHAREASPQELNLSLAASAHHPRVEPVTLNRLYRQLTAGQRDAAEHGQWLSPSPPGPSAGGGGGPSPSSASPAHGGAGPSPMTAGCPLGVPIP